MEELSNMTKEEAINRLKKRYETLKKRLNDPNDKFDDADTLCRRIYEDDKWLARKYYLNILADKFINCVEQIEKRIGRNIHIPEVFRR